MAEHAGAVRRREDPRLVTGTGEFYVEATATVPHESAVVRVDPGGGVTVVSGAAPQGQGHVTMFSRLVGDLLGVDPDAIDVRTGDTALLAQGGGTYGFTGMDFETAVRERIPILSVLLNNFSMALWILLGFVS